MKSQDRALAVVCAALLSTVAPALSYTLAAKSHINLQGVAITFDSFDSADPFFSTNGRYDPDKAKTNGDLASISGIVNVGNATVHGNVFLGPTAIAVWSSPGIISGDITNDFDCTFQDVVLPAKAWLPPVPLPMTIDGVHYAFTFLQNGDYVISGLRSGIYVGTNAHVTIKLVNDAYPQDVRVAGVGAQAGSLVLYMAGANFRLDGPQTVDSGNASSFSYYGLACNTNVTLAGRADFTGTIYAPQANVALGGGIPTCGFVASIVASTVTANSTLSFHFDENLDRLAVFPPLVLHQPQGQTVLAGSNPQFTVGAKWASAYQWSFNGLELVGATDSALILTNVGAADSGSCSVRVSNAFGSVVSSNAVLVVRDSPAAILNSPALSTNGCFHCQVDGISGRKYAIQASTNLLDWLPVLTNTAPFAFAETNHNDPRHRFYRAVYYP